MLSQICLLVLYVVLLHEGKLQRRSSRLPLFVPYFPDWALELQSHCLLRGPFEIQTFMTHDCCNVTKLHLYRTTILHVCIVRFFISSVVQSIFKFIPILHAIYMLQYRWHSSYVR